MELLIFILLLIIAYLCYQLSLFQKQNYFSNLINIKVKCKANKLKKIMFKNELAKTVVNPNYPKHVLKLIRPNDSIEIIEESIPGHSNRIAYYAYLLGKRLGLSEYELNNLYFAAYFHDLGKIKIDRSILKKKLKLTNREYDKMKYHPLLGYEILYRYFSRELCEIVKYHHERLDGSGYYNLKTFDRTIMILGIVDSFDAMISNRVYKTGMCLEEIKYEFKMCTTTKRKGGKGILFNKEYVDEFLKMIDEII